MDRISFIMYVRFGLCVVLLHVKCLPCLHCIFGVCQYSIVNKNSNQSWNFFDCLFILLFHSKCGSFKMPFVRQHSIFYLYRISFSFLFERKKFCFKYWNVCIHTKCTSANEWRMSTAVLSTICSQIWNENVKIHENIACQYLPRKNQFFTILPLFVSVYSRRGNIYCC